jgi:hypothetical protein
MSEIVKKIPKTIVVPKVTFKASKSINSSYVTANKYQVSWPLLLKAKINMTKTIKKSRIANDNSSPRIKKPTPPNLKDLQQNILLYGNTVPNPNKIVKDIGTKIAEPQVVAQPEFNFELSTVILF